MRKFVIALAAAGSVLAFASPAMAQYYPQQQPYGYGGQQYGANYGYNGGYNQNYGGLRALQARINSIQGQIENLSARRILSRNEARDLREESRNLQRRLYESGRGGLNYREMQNIQVRIARLEQNVRREASDGNRYGRNGYSNGYNAYDRDRDGRDDRYEDDHGYNHDH
jgi:TolA-binding protein